MYEWTFKRMSDTLYLASFGQRHYHLHIRNHKIASAEDVTSQGVPKPVPLNSTTAMSASNALSDWIRDNRRASEAQRGKKPCKWNFHRGHSSNGQQVYNVTDIVDNRIYRLFLNAKGEVVRLVNVTRAERNRELNPKGDTAQKMVAALRK